MDPYEGQWEDYSIPYLFSTMIRANSQHASFSSTFFPISKCDFSSHSMSSKVLFVWISYALCCGLFSLKTAMLCWSQWGSC